MMKAEVKKDKNMNEEEILSMFKNGVHFGHRESKWYPKMAKYIHTSRNGIHIIDLEKTAAKLKEAVDFVQKVTKQNGLVLFVGTKRQARDIVKKYAQSVKMPYIIERWIGGVLTNFSVVSKLIKKFTQMKEQDKRGEFKKYTKKEQVDFQKEIQRLDKLIGGLEGMDRLPQALFVVDIGYEKTAIREAKRKGIPIVAMVDTNNNPDLAQYPIPANDDATKSIDFITNVIAESIKKGQEKTEEKKEA